MYEYIADIKSIPLLLTLKSVRRRGGDGFTGNQTGIYSLFDFQFTMPYRLDQSTRDLYCCTSIYPSSCIAYEFNIYYLFSQTFIFLLVCNF